MPQWGRNASLADIPAQPRRYGRWSILFALASLLLVGAAIGVFFALSDGGSEGSANAAALALGIVYFLVAPILHVIGIVFGFVGIARDDSRFSAVVGILLNILLVLIGAGLAYAGTRGAAY
ncbi:hypothetical protein [Mesorhizobium sp. IMUNJ 23232]|uniref:hypothetical protein n=1 Tax=Mesorhizobium sp. IMUNJ 23232 TaxID=3376064 RepID=UPI0037AA6CDB